VVVDHARVPLDASFQYRQPTESSKRLMASTVRRVFRNPPAEGKQEGKVVKSIKLYRVTLGLLSPQELVEGRSPIDKTKYGAFFMGEFDEKGELKDPYEPFLYWYLPIVKVDESYPEDSFVDLSGRPGLRVATVNWYAQPLKEGKVLDCVEIHAAGFVRLVPNQEPKKP
jgi:hypothetical protein